MEKGKEGKEKEMGSGWDKDEGDWERGGCEEGAGMEQEPAVMGFGEGIQAPRGAGGALGGRRSRLE